MRHANSDSVLIKLFAGMKAQAGALLAAACLLASWRCLMIFSVYEYLNGAHEYGLKRARAHY
jgi:hypothetical protein